VRCDTAIEEVMNAGAPSVGGDAQGSLIDYLHNGISDTPEFSKQAKYARITALRRPCKTRNARTVAIDRA